MKTSKIFLFFCFFLCSMLHALTWNSPVDVSSPAPDAFSPLIGVDSSGNAVAIWTGDTGTNYIVQGAILPFGSTTWIRTNDLSAPGQNVFNLDLSVSPNGRAVAIWRRSNGTNLILQGATLTSGSSTWTSTSDISLPGQSVNSAFTVATDPNSNAIATWSRSNGINSVIQAATLPFNSSTWTAPVTISNNLLLGQGNADSPVVSIDNSGNAVTVWQLGVAASTIIQASKFNFSLNTWTMTTDVATASTGGVTDARPDLAVDSSGNAVTVWRSLSGGIGTIRGATLISPSTVWTLTNNLSPLGQDATFFPKVGVDSNGNATSVWALTTGGGQVVQAASLPFNSSTWISATANLSTAQALNRQPQVAVDPAGNAVSVWVGADTIQSSNVLFGSSTWTAQVDISAVSTDTANAVVTVDPAGNAFAAWYFFDGANYIIQAANTVPSPPAISSILPTSGSTQGGTQVTITGTSFTGATAVNFGSTLATSFTVNSDTEIVAISPSHAAGTIDIRVTTPSGTSAISSADSFTYVASASSTDTVAIVQTQSEAVAQQNLQIVNQAVNTAIQEVQATGIFSTTQGTYPDSVNTYIIDNTTSYTVQVQLPPSWCQ